MTNVLYDTARNAFLTGGLNWTGDTLAAVLVKTTSGYTVNTATDQFLSTIVSGNRVATLSPLAGKTAVAGVADANDVTFPTVPGTQPVGGAVVIYKNTGTDTTSQLISYIDTATGLPATPNGSDITITWDNGSNKIFKL